MSVTGAIALYFIIWWTVLFAILPIGVRSQSETGETTAGTEPGAPVAPQMLRKAFWTTILAAFVFGCVLIALNYIEL
jgi:predicted secreted protein